MLYLTRLDKRKWILLLAALLGAGLLFWALSSASTKPVTTANGVSQESLNGLTDGSRSDTSRLIATKQTQRVNSTGTDAPNHAQPVTSGVQLAASLVDSLPDGAFSVDSNGQLLIDRPLRRRFDYFLAVRGERSDKEICAALVATARAERGAAVADAVGAWFDRYLAYQHAGAQTKAIDARAEIDALKRLRRHFLGEVAAVAWFADEESAAERGLARAYVLTDRKLTAEQRRSELARIDEQAPADERAHRLETTAVVNISNQTDAFDQQGTDAATRHRLRTTEHGAEVADRLAALDRERAAWQGRVDAASAEITRLSQSATENQRARRIDEYLARNFTEPESRRVKAMLNL